MPRDMPRVPPGTVPPSRNRTCGTDVLFARQPRLTLGRGVSAGMCVGELTAR
jgi:hypothetical protein